MALQRTSAGEETPLDPVGEAVADAVADVLPVSVERSYARAPAPPPAAPTERAEPGTASATGAGPPGWQVTYTVRLHDRIARLVALRERSPVTELLEALPEAAVRTVARFPHHGADGSVLPVGSPFRRALRDVVAAEILARYLASRLGRPVSPDLIPDTVEFLIELSSTRVESQDLTHGVVIADVLRETPRLEFAYPADIRAAKRAPLLFDGQRSVLIVDPEGRARTELQRHRLDRFTGAAPSAARASVADQVKSGALVAEATTVLGGVGFFLRADRSLWTFVDGQPLLVRRSEHWTAFPLELTASIENIIGGGSVAALVVRAAFVISAQPRGAILAIVDDARRLDGVVSPKDRYDLRNDIDRAAMRPETRLHHLIDAEELDERTLVRLATLDGATVLDRSGRLLAYGAIVTSTGSEDEGARTAAAKTLSEHASVVLKVSVDGDITIFRDGTVVTTLLSSTGGRESGRKPAGSILPRTSSSPALEEASVTEAGDAAFRFPEPPKGLLTPPANRVLAQMDDPQAVAAAVDELAHNGFDRQEIYVLCGPKGAQRLDVSGRHHGLKGRIYRFVEHIGDEREILLDVAEHLSTGGLAVTVPADDQAKGTAAHILGQHGAHDMVHFGKGHWEPVGA